MLLCSAISALMTIASADVLPHTAPAAGITSVPGAECLADGPSSSRRAAAQPGHIICFSGSLKSYDVPPATAEGIAQIINKHRDGANVVLGKALDNSVLVYAMVELHEIVDKRLSWFKKRYAEVGTSGLGKRAATEARKLLLLQLGAYLQIECSLQTVADDTWARRYATHFPRRAASGVGLLGSTHGLARIEAVWVITPEGSLEMELEAIAHASKELKQYIARFNELMMAAPVQEMGIKDDPARAKTGRLSRDVPGTTRRAKPPWEVASEYRAFFDGLGKGDIQELMTSPSDTMAVRASWQNVKNSLASTTKTSGCVPAPGAVQRFLEFVKGRLRTSIPQWWEELLQGVKGGEDKGVYFTAPKGKLYRKTGFEVYAPEDTTIGDVNADSFLVVVDGVIVRVRSDVCPEIRDDPKKRGKLFASACVDADKCYLEIHRNVCASYYLYCVSRKSGQLLWRSKVQAAEEFTNYSGSGGWHRVQLLCDKQSATVFGAGYDAAYIERFDVRDGTNTLRFSTSY
jgi:hypothetical protein